ncbi:lytic murein transglycosylase [Phyllobacterium salinisoli]|uniref:Lytic murein transglycosylase n=1 Tax=Phyllobacterium salinisoli TaxID=1899321 RepID=A0A368K4F5_9HYPH|nr:lytic murein transglycosylase [Phyllobacterium salinisoli]
MESLSAPLCPAGHLPRMGGDWLTWYSPFTLRRLRLVPNVDGGAISPHAGEMSGRTEGGAVPQTSLSKNEKL